MEGIALKETFVKDEWIIYKKNPIYYGQRILESGKNLRDYKIRNKDTLVLKMKIYVINQWNNDFSVIHVLSTDLLSMVITLFNSTKKTENQFLRSNGRHILVFYSEMKLDLRRTFESYKIPNESTIELC
eukprot:GHVL01017865.1.p1 GENE.GHVL01017865.1~~GHVL01017865.1.p1  ORF type:complete len:129 (-),score=3.87 GHVL01017865.1:321-707(-)